jgi:hypothetical protein
MKTIADITRNLSGQLCWGVKWDSQLNMSMSFGDPHLKVREPYSSKSRSLHLRELAAYRQVTVSGRWWLWIFCAHWKLTVSDSLTATASSSARMKMMVMARLDGQKLKDIQVNPVSGATEFTFDLGANLRVRRFEADDSDIWTLYKPNGYVLGVRGDGTYTYDRGTKPGVDIRCHHIK